MPCFVQCPRLDPGCGGTGTGVSARQQPLTVGQVFVRYTEYGSNVSDRGYLVSDITEAKLPSFVTYKSLKTDFHLGK